MMVRVCVTGASTRTFRPLCRCPVRDEEPLFRPSASQLFLARSLIRSPPADSQPSCPTANGYAN